MFGLSHFLVLSIFVVSIQHGKGQTQLISFL